MKEFPSVTQVMEPYTDFSMIPDDVLEAASERGTAVHQICASIALGFFTITPEPYQGYITSFRSWFDSQVQGVSSVEERLFDTALGFSGQPDFIGTLKDGSLVLIDWKTPVALQRSWQAQLAAYQHLARTNGFQVERAGSLRLSADGKVPKMKWYEDSARDFNAFLNALNAHNFFKT
jgi:hypothetical protein